MSILNKDIFFYVFKVLLMLVLMVTDAQIDNFILGNQYIGKTSFSGKSLIQILR